MKAQGEGQRGDEETDGRGEKKRSRKERETGRRTEASAVEDSDTRFPLQKAAEISCRNGMGDGKAE